MRRGSYAAKSDSRRPGGPGRALGVVLIALGLAGCNLESGGRTQTGSSQLDLPPVQPVGDRRYQAFSDLGYQLEWTGFAVVPNRRKVKFVDAWDDILVVHESGNSITVMDSDTGRTRWNQKLDDALAKFTGNARLDEGDIISVSETELFWLDDQTGVLKDRQRLATLAFTRPEVFGSIVVVGGATGEVLGHNLASGYKQWGYQLTGVIRADPLALGGSVCVCDDRGQIFILNSRTGSSHGFSKVYRGLVNNPVAGNGLIYVASLDQSIWAFPLSGGEAQWRVRTEHELREQPTFHDGVLYLTIPGRGLTAFNGATGAELWSASEVHGEVIAARDRRIIVWGDDSRVWLVDPARGDVALSARLDGVSTIVTDSFADGNLYAVEPRGRIQKYSPR